MRKVIFSLFFIVASLCLKAQGNIHYAHAVRYNHSEGSSFNWAESVAVDIPIAIMDKVLNIYTETPQTYRIIGDMVDVDNYSKQWSALDGNDVACSLKLVSINGKFFCYIYYADLAYFYRIEEYE
jgi:hypothetical protein